jgi:ATP-binding cassette subfamily F protein 3
VLDEPTNHLDLAAREQLESVLGAFGGTLLFISHDRYFVDKLASELWLIGDGVLRRWEGGWSSYQRVRAAGKDAPVVEYATTEGRLQGDAGAPPRAPARRGTPSRPSDGVRRVERVSAARPQPQGRRTSRASPVRRVEPMRALEARIEAMELQLRQLTEKVSQIAQSGNYLETRRVGEEHAALEKSLRELYDEWAKVNTERPEA